MYEPLPVSVVIPRQKGVLDEWLFTKCLPQVRSNNPAEIILVEEVGSDPEKSYAGAVKATQPYLIFVDVRTYLYEFALIDMYRALEADKKAAFSYCDAYHMSYPEVHNPYGNGVRKSRPWDPEILEASNYIEPVSLIRRSAFTEFDLSVETFQGSYLWRKLAANGYYGSYIPTVLFQVHHLKHELPPFSNEVPRTNLQAP